MMYDFEADWNLLYACNYRCAYCFFTPTELQKKIKRYATPEKWSQGFDSTDRAWLINITGGEPSIYPDFIDLCEQLTQSHLISINSNLSHRCIDNFIERIDPAQVVYINAALHPEEREKKKTTQAFIDRVQALINKHFNVFVSVVMTPRLIQSFPELSDAYQREGIFLIPKIIRGHFQGIEYPNGYTPDEKNLIERYLALSKANCQDILDRMGEPPTENMFADVQFLDGYPDYRGRLCRSGHSFFRIHPNGTVVRCSSYEVYGNILENDIRFKDEIKLCNTSYCPYWCEKYSIAQNGNPPVPTRSGRQTNRFTETFQKSLGRMRKSYYFISHGDGEIVAERLKKMIDLK